MSRPATQLAFELLSQDPNFESVMLFYKPSLERLGIAVSVRTIDPTQYENRLRELGLRHHHRVLAGSHCRPATSSVNSGDRKRPTSAGSRNFIGIKNPAIDKLIDRVIFAKDRDDLVAATKALDRVLLWNHYVVPQWTYPQVAHGAVGSFRPAGGAAEIRPVGVSDDLVVGRRARQPRPGKRS